MIEKKINGQGKRVILLLHQMDLENIKTPQQ